MISKAFLLLFLFLSVQSGIAEPRVAVIPFSSVGVSEQDAQSITLLFETSFQQTKAFTLIEMVEVDKLLAAQKYTLSGVVDESQAVEIGRLLSADQIVVGTVGKVANLYYLTVKIIAVETGENLVAEKAQAQSLADLIGMLDDVAWVLAGKEPLATVTNVIAKTTIEKMAQETLHFDNGRYVGEVRANKPHGTGTFYYATGNRYEGAWSDGKKHGVGTFYFETGDRYEGKWSDDKRNGWGIYYWTNGNRYEGEWVANSMSGHGIKYFADGSRYEGEWSDDKRNGTGTLYYANGSRYEGEWRDDKRNGIGAEYFVRGERREGEWREDKYIGGTYYWANGRSEKE